MSDADDPDFPLPRAVFNYIDRTNIGNAKVAGMSHDLNLSATDYATALSIFFIGYLLNEIPSNMVLSRSRPSLFLPALMFTWSVPMPLCVDLSSISPY